MGTEVRNEPVSLRLARDELHMLKALAASDGISQSDVLRMLLRREWTARFGAKAPGKPKR
jgi:hypothetical protein